MRQGLVTNEDHLDAEKTSVCSDICVCSVLVGVQAARGHRTKTRKSMKLIGTANTRGDRACVWARVYRH